MSRRSVSPACELALDHGAAGVHEGEAVAVEALQDEAFAAEQAGRELLVERDADRDALGGAQERVLLAQHRAAVAAQVERDDAAGIGRRERDVLALAGAVAEHGHEQRLAGEHALAGREQRAHEAAARRLRAAVAEDGLDLDAGVHVHEAAGLGDARLARVERDLHELHLLAEDLVVDLVRARARRRRRRRRSVRRRARRRTAGANAIGSQSAMPWVKTWAVRPI